MRIVVIVEAGPAAGRRWLLRPGDRMVFGRTERSDIVIGEDPLLSSCHFRISIEGDDCQIEDMQSTNGTKLNGQRIAIRPLADGDQVSAGQSKFTIRADSPEVCLQSTWVPATSEESAADPPPTPRPAKTPPAPVNPSPPRAEVAESASDQRAASKSADSKSGDAFDAFATSATPTHDPPAPPTADLPVADLPAADPPAATKVPEMESPSQPAEESTYDLAATLPPRTVLPTAVPPPTAVPQPPPTAVPQPPPTTTPPPAARSPVIPPSSTPGIVPPGFELDLHRRPSGLWSGTQATPLLGPADLAVILAGCCPLQLIVDFPRSGLDAQEISNAERSRSLESDAPATESSQMLPGEEVPMDQWIRQGWGRDGMVVLVTHVDIDPILDYFRSLLTSADRPSSSGVSRVGRSSTLRSLLSSGDTRLAQEIIEPCEAILLESPSAVGGWELWGDDRIEPLLDSCQMHHRTK